MSHNARKHVDLSVPDRPRTGARGRAVMGAQACSQQLPWAAASHTCGYSRPPGCPASRPFRAAVRRAGPDVKHRGLVGPNEDGLQHLRFDLRVHAEE